MDKAPSRAQCALRFPKYPRTRFAVKTKKRQAGNDGTYPVGLVPENFPDVFGAAVYDIYAGKTPLQKLA